MIVGHLHAVVGEGGTKVFTQGELHGQEIRRVGPAIDGVFNGALAVIGDIYGRGGVFQDVRGICQGVPTGGLHVFGGSVVGGGNDLGHTAAAQSGVVSHLGIRQGLVGKHDQMTVGSHQFRVVQGDLLHGAGGAGHFNVVPDGKGMGGQDDEAAGHIGQDILGGQGDAQGGHGQQGYQGGGVHDIKAADHNDGGDDIQDHFDAGSQIFLHPDVQFGPGEELPCQLQCCPDDNQTQQQGDDSGQYVSQGDFADRLVQDRGKVGHSVFLLDFIDIV